MSDSSDERDASAASSRRRRASRNKGDEEPTPPHRASRASPSANHSVTAAAAAAASASSASPSVPWISPSAFNVSREMRALAFVHRGYGLDQATRLASIAAAQQQAEADVIAHRAARHAKRRREINGTVGRKRNAKGESANHATDEAPATRAQQSSEEEAVREEDQLMHDAASDRSQSDNNANGEAAAAVGESSDESSAPPIPIGHTPHSRRRSAASVRARARAAADSPVDTRGMRFFHRQPPRRVRSRKSGQFKSEQSKLAQKQQQTNDAAQSESEEAKATGSRSPSRRMRTRHSEQAEADAHSSSSSLANDHEKRGSKRGKRMRGTSSSSSEPSEDDGAAEPSTRPARAAARKSVDAFSKQIAQMNPTRVRRKNTEDAAVEAVEKEEQEDTTPRGRRRRSNQAEAERRRSSSSEEEEQESAAPSTRARGRRSASAAASSSSSAAARKPTNDAQEREEESGDEEEEQQGESQEDEHSEEQEEEQEEEESTHASTSATGGGAASATAAAAAVSLRRKRGAKRRRVVVQPRKKSRAASAGGKSGLAGIEGVEALLRRRTTTSAAPASASAVFLSASSAAAAGGSAAARPFSFHPPFAGGASASSTTTTAVPAVPKYKCVNRIREGHNAPLYFIAFNTLDARHKDIFASVGSNRCTVYRALPSGAVDPLQLYIDEDPTENYYTLVFSIDLRTGASVLLLAGENAIIRLVDLHLRKIHRRLIGHGGSINELKIHPLDLSIVASASKDMSVRIWNIQNGICIAILAGENGHKDEVLSLDFSSDGERIVSSGMDHCILIWKITKELKEKIKESYAPSHARGKGAAGSGMEGELQSSSSLNPLISISTLPSPTVSLSSSLLPYPVLSPFAPLLISSPVFASNRVHDNYVDHVRFLGAGASGVGNGNRSDDSNETGFILSKSTDEKIVLWTMRSRGGASTSAGTGTGTSAKMVPLRLREFEFTDCDIWYIRFGIDWPHQRYMAVGNKSGTIFLWNLEEEMTAAGTTTSAAGGGENQGTTAAATAAAATIGSSQFPRKLTTPASVRAIRCVAFSSDARIILAGAEDGSIFRWEQI